MAFKVSGIETGRYWLDTAARLSRSSARTRGARHRLGCDKRRADFHAEADQRWAEFLETGESIPWEEMRRCLMACGGEETPRPVPRKFAK